MTPQAEDVVALTAGLIAVDSVNPGLVAGAAGEREIVRLLTERLERTGFAVTVVHPDGLEQRPSLVALPRQAAGGPVVVLNGHLDTVGVAGMTDPFVPVVEGGRLRGRGAADMKGGVAALVVAAEHLLAASAPVTPVLALVADEEDASLGSEAVVAALERLGVRPDVCLVAEPTDLRVCRSLRGFGVAEVRFPGRAAHSSQPRLGVNALTHLVRFLHRVDQESATVQRAGGELMATRALGGTSAFVVPDHAECLVEVRTAPGQSVRGALERVRGLLDDGWDADLRVVAEREGWRLDADGPGAALADRLAGALGEGADFDAPYWMEAPLWQRVAPTVICGPSGGGLHAADEWVDVRQLERFTTALVQVLGAEDGSAAGADARAL